LDEIRYALEDYLNMYRVMSDLCDTVTLIFSDKLTKCITHGILTMTKRIQKKSNSVQKPPDSMAALRKAIAGQTKKELVDVLVEIAMEDRTVFRNLSTRFDVVSTPDELVSATRQAIADATDFDKRDVNHNFDYDLEAYGEVKRNLGRLIDLGALRVAMELSLELMKQGSYQVEMSDEGLMNEDIEDCLSVVLKSLKKCELPADELIAWCTAMLGNDRVEFIAKKEIESLSKRFQADANR